MITLWTMKVGKRREHFIRTPLILYSQTLQVVLNCRLQLSKKTNSNYESNWRNTLGISSGTSEIWKKDLFQFLQSIVLPSLKTCRVPLAEFFSLMLSLNIACQIFFLHFTLRLHIFWAFNTHWIESEITTSNFEDNMCSNLTEFIQFIVTTQAGCIICTILWNIMPNSCPIGMFC